MADENKVSVELTVEEKDALASLAKVSRALDDFGKSALKSTKEAEKGFGSLKETIGGVFLGGALLKGAEFLIDKIGEIPGAIADVVTAGIEATDVTRKLGSALALSGDFSQEAVQRFDDLASSISKLIGVDDEAVVSAITYAKTLGATNEQAEKIAKTAADLSVALGKDFNDVVAQLSMTLEGSAGRLSRVDSSLKDLSEEALKGGAAIDALANKFGGFASINADQVGVQIKNIGVAFGNVEEAIGGAIAASPALRGVFSAIVQSLEELGQFLKDNKENITQFTTDAVQGFLKVGEISAVVIDSIVQFGAQLKNAFEVSAQAILVAIGAVGGSVTYLLDKLGIIESEDPFGFMKAQIAGLTEDLGDLGTAVTPGTFSTSTDAVLSFTTKVEEGMLRAKAADDAYTANLTKVSEEQKLARETAAGDVETQISNLELLREAKLTIGQAEIDDKIALQEVENDALFQKLSEGLGQRAALEELERARKLEKDAKDEGDEKKHLQALQVLRDASRKAEQNQVFAQQKFEELSQKQRLENLKGTLGTISTLTSQNNKELFFIGKAAAVGQATIDGIAAVQKALASAPPPFNFVLAALVGVASAANIAKLASQQPPGFAQGGIVPGSSFSGDNVIARVNSGEMILNEQQQGELFRIANGGGGGANFSAALDRLGDRIENMRIVVEANGRELARVVRDQKEAGFVV